MLWHCWLGSRKGIRPVKNWVVGWWRGYLSGARCRLAYGPADATVSCFSDIQIGFTFLVSTQPGSPRQRVIKRVCVLYHTKNVGDCGSCLWFQSIHTCIQTLDNVHNSQAQGLNLRCIKEAMIWLWLEKARSQRLVGVFALHCWLGGAKGILCVNLTCAICLQRFQF